MDEELLVDDEELLVDEEELLVDEEELLVVDEELLVDDEELFVDEEELLVDEELLPFFVVKKNWLSMMNKNSAAQAAEDTCPGTIRPRQHRRLAEQKSHDDGQPRFAPPPPPPPIPRSAGRPRSAPPPPTPRSAGRPRSAPPPPTPRSGQPGLGRQAPGLRSLIADKDPEKDVISFSINLNSCVCLLNKLGPCAK